MSANSPIQSAAVLRLQIFTVSNAPSAASNKGGIIYVDNGAAGNPILAFSDGANWKRSDTGATIS